MNIKDMKKKSIMDLKKELSLLYRKRLKFRFEKTSGAEFKKNHLLRKIKKEIAQILTVITELDNKV